ncbi:universal stress protein [Clostridium cylindrosporum]|uniref:UspA domain-containing protein n=1 Tax=Clostridium cylindrosporum DSM 605 TaxID=1121307 RepID=A0A0J8DD61_CLOCY|nr:universal stress protein [Clostridium cylindrosporum]KMT22183.1 hypothetical protein CLCY_4c01560 [Clostridium cylindrosporum DSM 605]
MTVKRVLVPIDKSEKTLKSIEQLKLLFRKEEVQVVLLHVIDDFNVAAVDYVSAEFMDAVTTLSNSLLDRAEGLLPGYTVEKISILGSASKEIFNTSSEKNIDLIIMTKTGSGLVDKYILGSVTSKIVKKADIPVMVIP